MTNFSRSTYSMRTLSFLTKRYRLSFTHALATDFILSGKSGLHGHDAYIEITCRLSAGTSARDCGAEDLDRIVNAHVLNRLNNQHLNDIIEHGTGESLGNYIFNCLERTEIGSRLHSVSVVETRKNRFNIEKIEGA